MKAVSFKNIDTHLSHIDTAITDIVKIFAIYILLTNKRKKRKKKESDNKNPETYSGTQFIRQSGKFL